ncbi:transmembrane and death domain protein 1 [Phyllobates terribilis]|uniref:transmembrane and death domain protein 1 n=1 Tax=Phyllobates terribilis TaxID=111132 RepID=UPI003CCB54B0
MIMRIAQLLTPLECQHFYLRITGPDRDLAKLLGSPSPYSKRKRKRRDIVTIEDCTNTLKNWVETQGNTVYWDRVFSTLYKVGRVDVALELAKNLNQDKTMQMKKSVNELTKIAHGTKSLLIISENEKFEEGENVRQVRDLNTIKDEDWDLIVQRRKVPAYGRHLNEWCWPMVYGVIFGFLAAPLLGEFLIHMNSAWPNLNFTINSHSKQINFIDTLVIKDDQGLLKTDIYRKPTDRNTLLHFSSNHPELVKRAIPKSQFQRVKRIVTDTTLRDQRLHLNQGLRLPLPCLLPSCSTRSSHPHKVTYVNMPVLDAFYPVERTVTRKDLRICVLQPITHAL